MYGTLADWDALLKQVHDYGMKLMYVYCLFFVTIPHSKRQNGPCAESYVR